jgi:hypothetical protein
MNRVIIVYVCAALLAASAGATAQDRRQSADKAPAAQGAGAPAPPVEHGFKIESKYDGFARETVVALQNMRITCGGVRGARGAFKETCVSLDLTLHCPGKQLDYVRSATLRLVFEGKDWDARHPYGERALTVVADGETYKLGEMRLVRQKVDDGLFDERSKEALEISLPYKTFEKIARAETVEMSVGRTAFAFRDKNVAALRDLNNRVRF